MSAPGTQTLSTAAADDRGARIGHLLDRVADMAHGTGVRGLKPSYHDAAGAGAMRDPEVERIVLVTLLTTTGHSHVFALDRGVADHLRTQLFETKGRLL